MRSGMVLFQSIGFCANWGEKRTIVSASGRRFCDQLAGSVASAAAPPIQTLVGPAGMELLRMGIETDGVPGRQGEVGSRPRTMTGSSSELQSGMDSIVRTASLAPAEKVSVEPGERL